jgi:hypothetical protein
MWFLKVSPINEILFHKRQFKFGIYQTVSAAFNLKKRSQETGSRFY